MNQDALPMPQRLIFRQDNEGSYAYVQGNEDKYRVTHVNGIYTLQYEGGYPVQFEPGAKYIMVNGIRLNVYTSLEDLHNAELNNLQPNPIQGPAPLQGGRLFRKSRRSQRSRQSRKTRRSRSHFRQ